MFHIGMKNTTRGKEELGYIIVHSIDFNLSEIDKHSLFLNTKVANKKQTKMIVLLLLDEWLCIELKINDLFFTSRQQITGFSPNALPYETNRKTVTKQMSMAQVLE